MVNFIGAPEGQTDYHRELRKGMDSPTSPSSHDEEIASCPVHDNRVVERLADGNTVVKGHDCKDKDLNDAKKVHGEDLQHAVAVRDGFPSQEQVTDQCGCHTEV